MGSVLLPDLDLASFHLFPVGDNTPNTQDDHKAYQITRNKRRHFLILLVFFALAGGLVDADPDQTQNRGDNQGLDHAKICPIHN
jgi:hypothetical protein